MCTNVNTQDKTELQVYRFFFASNDFSWALLNIYILKNAFNFDICAENTWV